MCTVLVCVNLLVKRLFLPNHSIFLLGWFALASCQYNCCNYYMGTVSTQSQLLHQQQQYPRQTIPQQHYPQQQYCTCSRIYAVQLADVPTAIAPVVSGSICTRDTNRGRTRTAVQQYQCLTLAVHLAAVPAAPAAAVPAKQYSQQQY